MGSAKFVEHKGHKIWMSDYRGMHGEELVKEIKANHAEHMKARSPDETQYLQLVDITDSIISRDVLKVFEGIGEEVKNIDVVLAVVGVIGLKRVIVDFLIRVTSIKTKLFSNREEAMDWLVECAE